MSLLINIIIVRASDTFGFGFAEAFLALKETFEMRKV